MDVFLPRKVTIIQHGIRWRQLTAQTWVHPCIARLLIGRVKRCNKSDAAEVHWLKDGVAICHVRILSRLCPAEARGGAAGCWRRADNRSVVDKEPAVCRTNSHVGDNTHVGVRDCNVCQLCGRSNDICHEECNVRGLPHFVQVSGLATPTLQWKQDHSHNGGKGLVVEYPCWWARLSPVKEPNVVGSCYNITYHSDWKRIGANSGVIVNARTTRELVGQNWGNWTGVYPKNSIVNNMHSGRA
mmetsp:Transcript_78790/g.197973  ORF Transcript_78790/g.197973 Transcript_78790/m.197973 type:complete len:242 (-) Transcript_78790:15-740(-)